MRKDFQTIQVPVYIADDETVFCSERDCQEYEMRKKLSSLRCKMFDRNFMQAETLDDCKFFYPSTKQDIIDFIEVNNFFGTIADGISPTEPISIYEFNSEKYRFEDMREKIEKVIEAFTKLKMNNK